MTASTTRLSSPKESIDRFRKLKRLPEEASSAFLQHGWRGQSYELGDLEVSDSCIRATATIQKGEAAPDDDPSFYLSSTVTLPLVFQLAIVHAITNLGMKKSFPVWSREFSIENHRRIRQASRIPVELVCFETFQAEGLGGARRPGASSRQNFRYTYSIDNGGFTGKAWIVFRPLASDA